MHKLTPIFLNKQILKKQLLRTIAINSPVINKLDNQAKPWQKIPGPLSLPLIGQLLHFLPGGWLYKRPIELQELLYTNYGPIVRLDGNLGFDPIIYVFDPEAGINLFRREDPIAYRPGFDSILHHRKKYYNNSNEDFFGLIIDNGEGWRKMRYTVNPIMLKPKTIKQYANIMAEVADDMIQRIRRMRDKNNMIEGDFSEEMNLWSLESMSVVALGQRLNCFDPNLSEDSPVKELIAAIHGVLKAAEKLDFQPSLWKYIATPEYKKAMKIYQKHMKLSEYFIDKARDEMKLKKDTNDNDKSILEKLLEIDRKAAIAMANDMMLAGVDTTATATVGLLYLLAINPDKQNKLREEILKNEEKRPFLRACVKESLRLFPLLSGNFRKTTKEHDILGYRIPKDMTVIIGNQQLCIMEEQFPRPKEFIPERWLVDKTDPLYYGNAHPFSFTPFGFGVRSCIGQRIAQLEIDIFVSKIVENFQLEWLGPPPKRTRTSTINMILPPYNFIFKDV